MDIRVLRKGSRGILGTYENCNHHAQLLLPIVKALEKAIPKLGFAEWGQAHNVHRLTTKDGRMFTLRGANVKGQGYMGITLFYRASRSDEVPLMTLAVDDWYEDFQFFCHNLKSIAEMPPACLRNSEDE